MNYLKLSLVVTLLVCLCSCEKSNCQTKLEQRWVVVQNSDSARYFMDSVNFTKGDSVFEKYKVSSTDSFFQYNQGAYFISDDCMEVDYTGNLSWMKWSRGTYKFDISQVTTTNFEFRSQALRNCDSCLIKFHR